MYFQWHRYYVFFFYACIVYYVRVSIFRYKKQNEKTKKTKLIGKLRANQLLVTDNVNGKHEVDDDDDDDVPDDTSSYILLCILTIARTHAQCTHHRRRRRFYEWNVRSSWSSPLPPLIAVAFGRGPAQHQPSNYYDYRNGGSGGARRMFRVEAHTGSASYTRNHLYPSTSMTSHNIFIVVCTIGILLYEYLYIHHAQVLFKSYTCKLCKIQGDSYFVFSFKTE